MIISKRPLTLVEVQAYAGDTEEKRVMHDYLKTFVKVSKANQEKIISSIRALNNPKIKEETMMKLIDFLPKDVEDLSKIFNEVTLSEEESQAILAITKDY